MPTLLSVPRTRYLLALGLTVATVLFLLLGIGALGIVGDGDRDTMFLLGPAVVLLVGVVTGFRAIGMAVATSAAALATLAAGAVAVVLVATDREAASLVDVVGLSVMYAGLFAAAAWLFRGVRAYAA